MGEGSFVEFRYGPPNVDQGSSAQPSYPFSTALWYSPAKNRLYGSLECRNAKASCNWTKVQLHGRNTRVGFSPLALECLSHTFCAVEAGMGRPRMILADDHSLVMDGLRKMLEPQFDIVAMVTDGRELVAAAPRLLPDVILLDIAMPLLNGIAAGRQLKK